MICYKAGTEICNRFFNRRFRRLLSPYPNDKPAHKKRPSLQPARPFGLYGVWICLLWLYDPRPCDPLVVRRDVGFEDARIQFHIPLELVRYAL